MPRSREQSEKMRAQARAAILEGALAVFGEKGFGGATTAEVAERAGVSKGLVFNYFPTKDALLEALIEHVLGESLGHWERAEWAGPPEAQLARIVEVGVAQVLERPAFYRLYFSLVLQPGGSSAVSNAVGRLMPRLKGYYGRTQGLMAELGSETPEIDSKLFQMALNGLVQSLAAEASLAAGPDLARLEPLKRRLLEKFLPTKQRKKT